MRSRTLKRIDYLIDQLEDAIDKLDGMALAIVKAEELRSFIHENQDQYLDDSDPPANEDATI